MIVTEREKKFEYDREHLFEAFAETIDGYAFAGNLKTGTFMYSRQMVREFAIPGQVVEHAAAFWGDLIHPEDREMFLDSNQEIADGRADKHAIRYRAKNGKGEWVHLLCRGKMIRDEQGIPDLFAGVIFNLDNKEVRALKEQLYHTEQLYQLVQNYTELRVWEYDLDNENIEIQKITDEDCRTQETKVIPNAVEGIVSAGQVHPDSIALFLKMHERIRNGEESVTEVIRFKRKDDTDVWQKITYISIHAEDNHDRKAVGIAEDVTAQKEAEIRAFNQEKMREIMVQDTLYTMHLNLDTRKMEAVWSEDGSMDIRDEITYQDVYEKILQSIANADDKKRFKAGYSDVKMQEYAQTGENIAEFEYRRIYGKGIVIWVNLSFKIIASPTTGNKILFVHARNIDLAKRRELALRKKAEIDEITGLYNLGTAKLLIEDMQGSKAQQMKEKAFLLINIDNFKEVNHIGGFVVGDELLHQMAAAIQEQLPLSAITGHVNGDTFLVYFSCENTSKQIRKRVQEIVDGLNGEYVCGQWRFDITVSAGAICPGSRNVSYDFLYQKAYDALDAAKRTGGGCLRFFREIQGEAEQEEEYEQGLASAFRKSLLWMEKGESRKEVYRIFMEYIGRCYGAEEVTLFRRRREDGELVREVGWNAYKKGPTLEIDEGDIEKFDAVLKESQSGTEIYIDGEESPGYEQILRVYNADRLEYPVFLMGHYADDMLMYGILVEKCDARIVDMAAREAVMDMLRCVEDMYNIREDYERAMKEDRNTGVNNYESYEGRVERFDEDTLNSLGMVGVRMVDLKNYNQQYGNKKGDESLAFIAAGMARLFGRSNCYRVGRTRFIAVCENMVYEEFIRRYKRLQEEIEKGYSEWIVTANAWEDASISAVKMQEQLEEKLTVARNIKKKNDAATSEKAVNGILQNIQEWVAEGSFCTFLQPKANAKTGEVCGAEALIRLRDPEKGIVPPGSFLPAIERAGLIRHIDLFVLEDVCRLLKGWIAKGWKTFPISLNYSRATVLEPDILEETNRIVDRYGVPKNLLEIEITESIGSVDNISLKKIVERFADCGYKIALDDYGSEYSNVYILYSLRLNTLKLDRRIVNDIYHDEKAKIVVESVIDTCKKFGIQSVAEGVETIEHLEVLREMSCDLVQGYYINKPLAEEEFYLKYIKETV